MCLFCAGYEHSFSFCIFCEDYGFFCIVPYIFSLKSSLINFGVSYLPQIEQFRYLNCCCTVFSLFFHGQSCTAVSSEYTPKTSPPELEPRTFFIACGICSWNLAKANNDVHICLLPSAFSKARNFFTGTRTQDCCFDFVAFVSSSE